MLFAVDYKKESNRSNSKGYKCTCCNPVGNSFLVPVLDTVTEGDCHKSHTEKAEHTEYGEKSALYAELFIHILCVDKYTARGENSPEPEEGLSLCGFAKKRECAKLRGRVIAPEEGKCESVDKGTEESADAKDIYCF